MQEEWPKLGKRIEIAFLVILSTFAVAVMLMHYFPN